MTSLASTLSRRSAPGRTTPAAARLLFSLLERLRSGHLTVVTPDGAVHEFGTRHDPSSPRADLVLRDWSVCRDVLTGGDVAFAEGYMAGRWTTGNLTALLTLCAVNQQALAPAFYGRWWTQAVFRLRHLLRSNTRAQARRNIHAHYDLGNAFYALWLDPTMTYSSALFAGDTGRSLAAAQEAKYERILRQVAPRPGDHLLEIGCGWGGFAEYAARTRDLRVTAISLSRAQTAFARRRIGDAGLDERVRFDVRDYRDVTGQFDGVVSIEMYEAVGERYWPQYFEAVRRALKPGARACLQGITIAEARFDRYRQTSDFIQQYIFPGGMLSTPSRMIADAGNAGLDLLDHLAFGPDYAETLRRWLCAFDAAEQRVRSQGFDARFIRCWRFYLAYCAAGFASGSTDVAHFTFTTG